MKKIILSSILALALVLGLGVSNVAALPNNGNDGSDNFVDVLVGFDRTPGEAERAIVQRAGGSIKYNYNLVPAIAAKVPLSALEGLLRNPRVVVIEPDGEVFAIDYGIELDNTWGVKRVQAGDVHTGGNTGEGVKVAVIDSGIDYNHPELSAVFSGGYDFVNNDTDPMDDNGHGTHVAGTIAAFRDGKGVVGTSPGAGLYGLKVLNSSGSGNWSNVIAALEWAVNNSVKITNNSYGSSVNPGSIVQTAFDNSYSQGILHIAAAGNSGNCAGKGNNVGYPGRFASVVAVAAINKNDIRPCFSSTGPDVELSAPGVGINSTKLGGGYVEFSGTSMASPHVAGAAALVAAAGARDVSTVRQILRDTAQNLGNFNHYGYGLVNVFAAVAAVGGEPAPEPGPPAPLNISSISYSTSGGKNSDRHLSVAIAVADQAGVPVGGANVAMTLTHNGGGFWTGSGTTGSTGTVVFTLNNAPSGCYSTTINSVTKDGTSWDGVTPDNNFCK